MTKTERENRRRQIIAMRESGKTYREIGECLGMAENSVANIVYRTTAGEFELKEPKRQPAPKIAIYQVLKIAEKIKAETGRYPSYGKVVQGIENGSIDPWKYIRRGRVV